MYMQTGRSSSGSPCRNALLQSAFANLTLKEAAHWMMRWKLVLARTGESDLGVVSEDLESPPPPLSLSV